MGSVTDFLFEGKPPKSVTTYGQTIKDVPKWLSDYTQGLIARANAAAAEPYIPYGGPRIAGFTPAQEASFGLTEENLGAYQPFVEGAAGATMDVLGGPSPLEEAQPYLGAGTEEFPDAAGRYMDPYIQHVLDRNEALAGRTLSEEFMPQLTRTFAGAGQFGSRGGQGSMEDIGVRGIRDITEGLNQQNLASLSAAYGQAGQLFGADRTRDLQAGATAGQLGVAGGQLGLMGAEQLGALGEFTQQAGITDAATLEAIGMQQQGMDQRSLDLGYQDFLEQRDLPMDRVKFMSDIVRGLPTSTATTTREFGPASVYQPSGLSQIAGAYGVYEGLKGDRARGGYIDDDEYARGGLAHYARGGKRYPMDRSSRWAA